MEPRIRFPEGVEVVAIQTHTSWVWLVGEEVLKVKKPVRFSFLDYSTSDLRRRYCELEVALNRRFSPEVYLGVVGLCPGEDGRLAAGPEEEAVEWGVRLRRLPDGSQLDERLAAGTVRASDMTALAESLARFYAIADTGPGIAAFGGVDQIRENTVENFETTLHFPPEILPDETRRKLRRANDRFLDSRAGLFAARAAAGRVLDGHGDLKPENIFLTDAGPVITDCIEFNDRFRYGDLLADVGYLTMGLRAAGREDLREAFLERFGETCEPGLPRDLLAFYETYRAVVKGKIEGYRALQPEVPREEREEARRIARAHFDLALHIAPE